VHTDDPRSWRLDVPQPCINLYSELVDAPRALDAQEAAKLVQLVDAWRDLEHRKHIALMTGGPTDAFQAWYAVQCDGAWEHASGITIATLDNPGWTLTIDLMGTPLEGRVLDRQQTRRDEDDWLDYGAENGKFHAACGPRNLGEAITSFLAWAA
jgi:hypothetical protein